MLRIKITSDCIRALLFRWHVTWTLDFLKDAFEYNPAKSTGTSQSREEITNSFRNVNATSPILKPTSAATPKLSALVPQCNAETSEYESRDGDRLTHLLPSCSTSTASTPQRHEEVTTPKLRYSCHKVVRQRKFPGPAGLLPEKSLDCSVNTSLASTSDSLDDSTSVSTSEEVICSQNSPSTLTQAPWLRLTSDFSGLQSGCDVAWVKRRATARQLVGRKVPVLTVVLKHIDFLSKDPSVVLEDKTGTINGTLHRDVVEEYTSQLKPGTALVLHQMGVVSTGFPTRRHYLNITLNNVVSIYDCPSEDSNFVRVTKVKDISRNQLNELINISKTQLCSSPSATTNSLMNSTVNVTPHIPGSSMKLNLTGCNMPRNRGLGVNSRIPSAVQSDLASCAGGKEFHSGSLNNNIDNRKRPEVQTVTKATFQPKVPRMCENVAVDCTKQERILQLVNCGASVGSLLPEIVSGNRAADSDNTNIADSIFEGFDCSSLFEEF